MITVFGEGRGFRVVWLLEEMGLAYRLRPVDLLAGVEHDAEYLAINPAGFIPAIQDGDVTMVESIAIMEYLMARYGRRRSRRTAQSRFPRVSTVPSPRRSRPCRLDVLRRRQPQPRARGRAAELGAGKALEVFESRLGLVTRQLARSSYLAGDAFTAADISVTYALEFAQRTGCFALGEAERAYVTRTSEREAYKRAMDTCQATKAWAAKPSAAEVAGR